MFGYINVNRKELSQQSQAEYQSYYCGLCRQLKQVAGVKGQMLLNYDMTFLIVLLTGLYEFENETTQFRCAIHPAKRHIGYINEATRYAADMDIVLSYHSLMDDYVDEGNVAKKTFATAIQKDYDRISKQYPKQVAAVENYIKKLAKAEAEKEKNLDRISGYTGEMMATLFAYKEDEWKCDLENLGFYMGKFIYILDAYEDYEKDMKKGNYNPLKYVKTESREDYETFCNLTLTSLMAECAKSFERMPILLHADILRNILYSGVWSKYEYIQIKDGRKAAGDKTAEGKKQ